MSFEPESLRQVEKNFSQLNLFLKKVQQHSLYSIALANASSQYSVKQYRIQHLNPSAIIRNYQKVWKLSTKLSEEGKFFTLSQNWLESELKIFIWVVLCYSFLNNTELAGFTSEDFNFLSRVFPFKDRSLIEFQVRMLLKKERKVEKWTKKEDELLTEILKSNHENKWNKTAKKLFKLSQKSSFKSPKQCRERWQNHLNPQILKRSWSLKEDFYLLESVVEKGKKWSQISKGLLFQRTEHTVKNRYNSLIRQSSKTLRCNEKKIVKEILGDLKLKMSEEEKNTVKYQSNDIENLERRQEKSESEESNNFLSLEYLLLSPDRQPFKQLI